MAQELADRLADEGLGFLGHDPGVLLVGLEELLGLTVHQVVTLASIIEEEAKVPDERPRMAIFVSKYDHCLMDLLYRHQTGELPCDVRGS